MSNFYKKIPSFSVENLIKCFEIAELDETANYKENHGYPYHIS